MRAMGRAEGVVHIDIRHLGQLLGERRVVGLFLVVIADVFQQDHVARLHLADGLFDLLADAIVHEADGPAEQFRQFHRHRAQGHGGLALAFGPAEVGGQDQLPPARDKQAERRQGLHDARGIGDDHLPILFFHRHVVIHAHEHAFALDLQIFDRQFCHKCSLLIRVAKHNGKASQVKTIFTLFAPSGIAKSRASPDTAPL